MMFFGSALNALRTYLTLICSIPGCFLGKTAVQVKYVVEDEWVRARIMYLVCSKCWNLIKFYAFKFFVNLTLGISLGAEMVLRHLNLSAIALHFFYFPEHISNYIFNAFMFTSQIIFTASNAMLLFQKQFVLGIHIYVYFTRLIIRTL